MQYLYDFTRIFIPMLVVIDPAGTLPLFMALTERYTEAQKRAIARRATLAAAITGVLFVVVGQALFALLGVKFADFQIAGGILLVVLAILDLLSPGKPTVDVGQLQSVGDQDPANVSVVPLAVPLMVGPATLTTSLLLVSTWGKTYGSEVAVALVCVALLMVLVIQFGAMWFSGVDCAAGGAERDAGGQQDRDDPAGGDRGELDPAGDHDYRQQVPLTGASAPRTQGAGRVGIRKLQVLAAEPADAGVRAGDAGEGDAADSAARR